MSSAEGERREDFIVGSVQRWLGNPLTRFLLRFVTGESRGGSRLDLAIRRYVGEKVEMDPRDLLAFLLVSTLLNRGSGLFGYPRQELKKKLGDPVMRRGIANVLEGIGRYGVRRPFVTAAPFLVVWNYTNACNLRCRHCYQSAGQEPGKNELSTEEAKRAVDELADSGVVALAFSGGEPLLRRDLLEVGARAKERGLFLSVATNGTLLTRERCREMKGVFDYVEVSLDGFEETHDRFRGIPGVWRRTCEGIRNSVAEGLDTCVAITATHHNLKEIPSLIDFVRGELGAQRVMVFNYVPVGRGREMVEEDLSPQERWELLCQLYRRMVEGFFCLSTAPQLSVVSLQMAEGKLGPVPTHFASRGMLEALRGRTRSLADFLGGCGAGRLYCGLQPDGEVVPCVFLPIPLGNLRERRLKEIWGSSEVLWRLRDRDSLQGCGTCQYRYVCGGCRARAYGYFGDVQAADPGCPYNSRYWEELKASLQRAQA
ncbi:MAG: radical SAM protein [Hadesarchaea archaeon]|jgi:radical SAM protein with 4Fe4S-binding SPASM domain|nr:radical SAM protein [Hadesarchaea archaeon]